jgi:hypothetical protein
MNRKFRTAIAALIGALSVAVMVAPMASAEDAPPVLPPFAGSLPQTPPFSASLSITMVGGGWVRVVVVLQTSSYAEARRLFMGDYRVEYTLWGEDPGADERRYGPVPVSAQMVRVEADGATRVYNSIQLDWRYLDEDFSQLPLGDGNSLAGRDEIYAVVRVGNYRVQTQTVYGYF